MILESQVNFGEFKAKDTTLTTFCSTMTPAKTAFLMESAFYQMETQEYSSFVESLFFTLSSEYRANSTGRFDSDRVISVTIKEQKELVELAFCGITTISGLLWVT